MIAGVWRKGKAGLTVLAGVLVATNASANIGTGSSRVPFTDFLIDFYNVTNNVYVPGIALLVVVGTVLAINSGRVRIGEGLAKIITCVLILGLGVAWILNQAGANASIAAMF